MLKTIAFLLIAIALTSCAGCMASTSPHRMLVDSTNPDSIACTDCTSSKPPRDTLTP